jgi:hypothetical protein
MYVHLTNTVYALLMPMALPTARTRCPSALEDLGLLPSSRTPRRTPLHVRMFYGCCTRFANTCGSARGPRAASLGPWTPLVPRRLVRAPFGPPSMYVHI